MGSKRANPPLPKKRTGSDVYTSPGDVRDDISITPAGLHLARKFRLAAPLAETVAHLCGLGSREARHG